MSAGRAAISNRGPGLRAGMLIMIGYRPQALACAAA
jgi:hypothetical protein